MDKISNTKRTHNALHSINLPENTGKGSVLNGIELFWEGENLNPEVIASFFRRMEAAVHPMGAELAFYLGYKMAKVVNDPSFGLDSVEQKVDSGIVDPDKPHPFKGRLDQGCLVCGRPDRWHLHHVQRKSAQDDPRGEANR